MSPLVPNAEYYDFIGFESTKETNPLWMHISVSQNIPTPDNNLFFACRRQFYLNVQLELYTKISMSNEFQRIQHVFSHSICH